MGLDTVELVLEVEDEFNIPIPDELAETVLTVGDLERVVMHQLAAVEVVLEPDELWTRLVAAIVRSTGVERAAVIRSARFVADLGLD